MATTSRIPTSGTGATQTPTLVLREQPTQTQAVLHLRGASRGTEDEEGRERSRRIQWAEDVVDNEGLGRKKSKVCCIYHAPRDIDESSDESSSDSDDSDSGNDDGAARPVGGKKGKDCGHGHDHNHDHGKGKGKGNKRDRSPNAYERQPKVKGGAAKDSRK